MENGFKKKAKLIMVDLILRALRNSFGILNTVRVLILLKPFHEPIVKLLQKVQKTLKSIHCFFVKIFATAEITREATDPAES